MKLRQKFAAFMAALIIATSLPTFAASTNGVNKIITVAKDTKLEGATAPQLKIELKDELTSGQAFYLDLENAEWDEDIATTLNTDTNFAYTLSSNKKQLEVRAKSDLGKALYTIPMFTKVTGGEAAVIIDSNDTVVTGGKYVFAVSNNAVAGVTVADAKSFATKGPVAEISIEESHIGAFKTDKKQEVRFELRGSGFEFDTSGAVDVKDADGKVLYTQLEDVLIGRKAYTGEKFSARIIDKATLEVTIPADALDASQRGSLVLSGVQVKATKEAAYGDVNVTVSGDLNDTTDVLVAKYGDYGTELKVAKEYKAVAGRQLKDIEFTLSETVANSIMGSRETTFTFPNGITIENVSVKETKGLKDGAAEVKAIIDKKDDKNTNVFSISSIDTDHSKKASVTIKATLNIPASFDKDLNLVVEGRSLEEKKEIEVAKVTAPATVEVTPVTVKVGLAKQTGGKIVIKETEKDMIKAGKIFLAIDDSDIKYTKAPEVKVTEGNLKLDTDVELVTGGIEITVKGRSTEASTIEISGGELKVDRTVPEGEYAVKVGGKAISDHSAATLWNTDKREHNDIDAIAEKDFIIVGTPNTEDINNGVKNKAIFVIGKTTYTVNGEDKTMDTEAYLSTGGRTMVPVRYVSDALGVKGDQILWDNVNKTVTILSERIVQVKLGSRSMVINGATIPMSSAPEVKNGRVFIPVAEIARALGANVVWDEVARTATFN